MKITFHIACLFLTFLIVRTARAQTGPFDTENWPTTRVATQAVHYVATDGNFTPPGASWHADALRILTGGDQVTQDISIGGHTGKKVLGNYLNIADTEFMEWADDDFIDILVQVYGNEALFNAQGLPRNFNFLTGVLPELSFPNGGQIPVEAKNKKWNWFLFRIPNGTRPSDGTHYVGSIPANAQGGFQVGGVNGGTIRFEGVPNLIVRVIAFGAQGAFGTPEDINKFFPADTCDPEPNTNLAGTDIAAGVTNHVIVLNNGDQTVTFATAGPTNDQRRAVRPNGTNLNFAITDNYLGKPCNDPRAVKVCLDFYDDPAFAGANVSFGPESYATDDKGGTATYPTGQRQVMSGSGKWIRRSWVIPAVNLKGINVGTNTAGPRFISENGQVFVSRFDIAVLRTGTNVLAGIDPLATCYEDPNICTDAYGSYAELDLAKGIMNGLNVGNSGGDQEMIQAEAGPTNDRRLAIRPAREDGTPGFAHQYLNFAILNEALGPSSQPNARLGICATYYDDPMLSGTRFKPEVYITDRNGTTTFGFTPDSFFVTLAGSDKWLNAYWEIPDIKFNGVNQGPQAAARFVLSGKIFVTRLRYGVIRPCGPNAGVNPVGSCTGVTMTAGLGTNGMLRLAWPVDGNQYTVQSTAGLVAPQWQTVNTTPTTDGSLNVVDLPFPAVPTFYRLQGP